MYSSVSCAHACIWLECESVKSPRSDRVHRFRRKPLLIGQKGEPLRGLRSSASKETPLSFSPLLSFLRKELCFPPLSVCGVTERAKVTRLEYHESEASLQICQSQWGKSAVAYRHGDRPITWRRRRWPGLFHATSRYQRRRISGPPLPPCLTVNRAS